MKRYIVTGACITHVPVSTAQGRMLVTLYRDAMLPADVPEDRIQHLLDSNLIEEVKGGDAPAEEPKKLETVSGAPASVNARSSKGDLVEYGVAQGDDRGELDAMTRDQLLDRYVRKPE
ncbi:hypothetical protein MF672_038785 [Actinomadura sp. ATCC 31491]|uniref:Uncharacterized protein n=1 Tax=Actinomadura luzonensis TaxID=2805427 RepID=A0ABT0G516_9ACTN|nr:hypothetical protein [Actinomadura luzonensis]MCK2219701.1 hypothetical protein [Actinomadura luzonensis]